MTEQNKYQWVTLLVAMGLVMATLLFVGILISRTIRQEERNASKNRVQLCILSTAPERRSPQHTLSCYDDEEQDSGVKLRRYGEGIPR